MKTFAKWIAIPAMFAALLWSCKKDENKDYFLGGTNPVLSASDTALKFVPADSIKNAITIRWTNPNYQFTTGVSSQNVNYTLQIDTLGANFSSPSLYTLSFASSLTKTFVVTEINSIVSNNMALATGMQHTIQMRVVSSLGSNGTVSLTSNVLQFKITPYAPPPAVTPPSTGSLYLVGSATAGVWTNPVPVPSQQFTKVSATLYTLTIPLTGGQEFLLLPLNGDWTHKYSVKDKTVAGLSTGGNFGLDLSDNIPGPAASGTYKIDVNFQTGKFTVTKQ